LKLKTLLPVAFGKFHLEYPIELADGLNIIRGDNEAGKSTLGAFILGMFYGFKKEGKTRISRSPEFDRYRPWSGVDYRGSLTYEEGGRVYSVERSFEPDSVRIYDDVTGEDITRSFSQDSRKEYDFALRHLGLSLKEFRNTVWIGQLGSVQEPGLGTEIQGKLESILEGGAEDVSLGRALAALNEERARLKSPRSTRARLDLLSQEIVGHEGELRVARAREEAVREDMMDASDLSRQKTQLESEVAQGEKDLTVTRYSLLQGILSQVQELEAQAASIRQKVRTLEWARDLDPDSEETSRSVRNEKEALERRIAEIGAEAKTLAERRDSVQARVQALRTVESVGIDEPGVAALYPTKYALAKGQATKCERAANEARKELRAIEEEGQQKGYPAADLDVDVLRRAEDHNQTWLLAEKAKSQLELEAEKSRAAVASLSSGGVPALIYAFALVTLGVAVVCTLLGFPAGWPLFALSLAVFLYGIVRQRAAAAKRRDAQQDLAEKEEEVARQIARIEDARKVVSEFLAALGARSIEELRSYAREIASYRARLEAAKDKFERAQAGWFETSAEFSAVENELATLLRSSATIQPGETATEAAVASLRRDLRELQSLKQELRSLGVQENEVSAKLEQHKEQLARADGRELEIYRAAGVQSGQGLAAKIAANRELLDLSRRLQEAEGQVRALLSGRKTPEVQQEIAVLSARMGAAPLPGMEVSERDYDTMREVQEETKSRLADVNVKLASLEKGIRLRTEEGRPSSIIEEELARQRALEEELSQEHDALDLAHETLGELSASIRREFAPALNRRVGEILDSITLGRYTQIKISPDLEMSVIHPDTGAQAPAGALSGGTLDQCYFALRVAIAEAVTKRQEFPFFLDDSFVQYDDRRLSGALSILATLAARHQILVFSCHGREEEVARKMGLQYNRVVL
jgi:uncharacterized protein YhaN